jgi:catechol 2,3-dioxygenase-like lactoylglutathione lyase family enzyme
MSATKAYDVAYVRFRAPDLSVMSAFLLDFGMIALTSSPSRVAFRGHGTEPFVHMTDLGPPGFAGFGVRLSSRAELEALAAHDGVKIEPFDGPGGGEVVRLIDPDGFVVEAVAGQAMAAAIATPTGEPWNEDGAYPRQSKPRRVAARPSHVQRLGHVVLGVTNFRRSEAWYKERFGLVTSDEIQPAPDVALGAFLRCDRGDQPCDHHTLFLLERGGAPAGFMHAAFEVAGLDDLMAGHDHLDAKGYSHQWGVGRHILGSQVFDYWRDPFGHEIEHWTDGDQFVTADGGGVASMGDLMGVQWGMPMPPLPDPPITGPPINGPPLNGPPPGTAA